MLLVDTCGATGGVAVASFSPDAEVQFPAELLSTRTLPGRETQELLMTAVREALDEIALKPAGLDVLAVVSGPGSFTGVRIGMAAVKGLAEALGKPVVAISRLAVLAAQAPSDGAVQAWISAGRGDLYVGRYGGAGESHELMFHGQDALGSISSSEIVVVMEDGLPEPPQGVLRVLPIGLPEVLPLAVAKARAGHIENVAVLDANYLRVPDAELALRARKAAPGKTAG